MATPTEIEYFIRWLEIPEGIPHAVLYANDTDHIKKATQGKIMARIRPFPDTRDKYIKLQWYGELDPETVEEAKDSALRMIRHNFLNPLPPGQPTCDRDALPPGFVLRHRQHPYLPHIGNQR